MDLSATLQAFAIDKEDQWQRVLSPAHSALEKDLVLAMLLEQPLQAPGAADALPAEQACGTDSWMRCPAGRPSVKGRGHRQAKSYYEASSTGGAAQ